jgi:HSP20 family protein
MRYRYVAYRYSMMVTDAEPFDRSGTWRRPSLGVTTHPGWRPDVDVYETASSVLVTVDVAGVDDADLEVLVYEDVLLVEGRRRLPCAAEGVYQVAEIRQGPFRVGVQLPTGIRADAVEARYEQGLLRITLPKVI